MGGWRNDLIRLQNTKLLLSKRRLKVSQILYKLLSRASLRRSQKPKALFRKTTKNLIKTQQFLTLLWAFVRRILTQKLFAELSQRKTCETQLENPPSRVTKFHTNYTTVIEREDLPCPNSSNVSCPTSFCAPHVLAPSFNAQF